MGQFKNTYFTLSTKIEMYIIYIITCIMYIVPSTIYNYYINTMYLLQKYMYVFYKYDINSMKL